MATTHYRCHIPANKKECGYIGPKAEFETGEGHCCPRCDSEHVFPYRVFLCKECGETGELDDLTGETTAIDLDPIEEGWDSLTCCCGSDRIAQVDHNDHSVSLGRIARYEEAPPTIPELFDQLMTEAKVASEAANRATVSRMSL